MITTRIPECVIYGTVGSQMLDGLAPELARSLLLRAAQISENRWEIVAQAATAIVEALESHTRDNPGRRLNQEQSLHN